MPDFYIIFNKDTKEVIAQESIKAAAAKYDPLKFDYVHWITEISGVSPKLSSQKKKVSLDDKRTYAEKRCCGYIMESDALIPAITGQTADGAGILEATALWTTARNAIRAKYPKS